MAVAAILTEEHEDEEAQLQRGNLRLMGEVYELAALLKFTCSRFRLPVCLHGSLFCSSTCSASIFCQKNICIKEQYFWKTANALGIALTSRCGKS